jgi:ribosome maturation factor RimP
MDVTERVRSLVAPLVERAGAELYDVEFVQGTLRITVDQAGGVGMDLIGALTRDVSRELDDADPIPGRYTLEVSSPGLERPLRRPQHFAQAVGTTVSVKAKPGVEGDRRITGTLVAADHDSITVAPEGAPDAPRRLSLDDIERARTVFEWGGAPKPGRPGASSATQKKAARP